MKNPNQRIDLVLQALGNTEAPSGLEQRVSARIEQVSHGKRNRTSSTPSFLGRLRQDRLPFSPAYPVAITLLAVLGVTAIIAHHTPHPIARNQSIPLAADAPQPAPHTSVRDQPRTRIAPLKHLVRDITAQPPIPDPADPDTIALAETLAPSHPAPPRQLSQQERLMITILRSGEQEEIAALIPSERDSRFAQDQLAFNEYFARKNQPSNIGDPQ